MTPHPGRLKTRGNFNSQAKLTAAQASFIKQAWDLGCKQCLLARHFGVSHVQIHRIVYNIDWRHA